VKTSIATISLFLVALFTLSATALTAQDVTGTWQGSLAIPNAKPLRIVLKVSKGDDGSLKALNYSIDQGGTPLPVSSISLKGLDFNFAVSAIGGKYQGTLSPDGNTITGKWSQGDALPLNFTKATPATAWAIPEPPPQIPAMPADAKPEFEVATIKPSNPDEQGRGFRVRGREFSTFNTTLSSLLTFAYGLHPKQIVGAPAWVDADKFDITAQPDLPGRPDDKQWKAMLQQLLTERFKLTFHHDKRELSVYALEVTKTGSKLTKSQGDPNGLPGMFFRGLGNLPVTNATMQDFAGLLQSAVLDRPVIDQTGLTGRWDFTLNWTADESQFVSMGIKVPPPSDKPDAPPGLFQAIQEQLGLKLDAVKAPVDVLVIDKVEKPSPN
jgi:uncharacterized protein (TIGR03435 family)